MNLNALLDRPMYYHMDGTPYTGSRTQQTLAWARDFENRIENGRIIGQESLMTGVWVSTVWLGLDHGLGVGRPLFFETGVFVEGFGPFQIDMLDQDRWSSKRDAKLGHAELVKKYSHWKYVFVVFWLQVRRIFSDRKP